MTITHVYRRRRSILMKTGVFFMFCLLLMMPMGSVLAVEDVEVRMQGGVGIYISVRNERSINASVKVKIITFSGETIHESNGSADPNDTYVKKIYVPMRFGMIKTRVEVDGENKLGIGVVYNGVVIFLIKSLP